MSSPNNKTGLFEASKGGTETLNSIMRENVPEVLLDKVQIVFSRVDKLENKKRILYLHETAEDQQNNHLFNKANWSNFEKFVFVSYSQRNDYIQKFNLPFSKCIVINNCIRPSEASGLDKFNNVKSDGLNLIYHTTPHRGLPLLYYVYEYLVANDPNFKNSTLDVYSSFAIYGWEQRDEEFKTIFDLCRDHPNINYHGYQENKIVREALNKSHIFAYPCVYKETGCCAAMEAMYHHNLVVTSDLGVLPETTGTYGLLYPFNEDLKSHAGIFTAMLTAAADSCINRSMNVKGLLTRAKDHADFNYSVEKYTMAWTNLLINI